MAVACKVGVVDGLVEMAIRVGVAGQTVTETEAGTAAVNQDEAVVVAGEVDAAAAVVRVAEAKMVVAPLVAGEMDTGAAEALAARATRLLLHSKRR